MSDCFNKNVFDLHTSSVHTAFVLVIYMIRLVGYITGLFKKGVPEGYSRISSGFSRTQD